MGDPNLEWIDSSRQPEMFSKIAGSVHGVGTGLDSDYYGASVSTAHDVGGTQKYLADAYYTPQGQHMPTSIGRATYRSADRAMRAAQAMVNRHALLFDPHSGVKVPMFDPRPHESGPIQLAQMLAMRKGD